MKHSSKPPSPEMHPRKLSKQEMKDPHLVIEDFFNYAHLPQVRDKLCQWFETTVTGNFSKQLSGRERSNMVFFYKQIERLVEAAHIIKTSETSDLSD